MPYSSNSELPDRIKDHLPEHAQSIYREAFNNALSEYQDKEKRRNESESPEEVAHKVAWSAVKTKYTKDENSEDWIAK